MASGYYNKKHYYKNRKYLQPTNHTAQPERQARAYQTELLESALKGNRIIALGTGAGKTHIACMLIKHMKFDGSLSDDKKIMFLAPTDALVRQQASVISQSTDLRVRDYMGGSGISDWGLENWEEELTSVDVLVMVAQSALNALDKGVLLVSRIGLLIFDECHHARRNHPYRGIMRTLDDNVKRLDCDSPKILGLSASIVTRNLKDFDQVEKEIQELEEILHSKAVTTTDAHSMSIHVTNPTEQPIFYEPYLMGRCDYMGEMKVFLNFFLQRDNVKFAGWEFPVRNTVEVCKTAIADCIYALYELGTKPCIQCTLLYLEHLDEYRIRFSGHIRRIFTELDSCFLGNTITVLRRLLQDLHRVNKEDSCLSPKVLRLCEVIKEFKFSEKAKVHDNTLYPPLLSGIVFVNRRITAVLLKDIFEGFRQRNTNGYSDIHSGSVVGHGSTSVVPEAEMNIFEQEKVLQGFRYKELNILFATNVLEEGLDVPQCNLIIRFDLPLTPRSYIQSKGRARNKEAMLYHMIQKDEIVAQTKHLDTFKRIESILTSTCMSREEIAHERVEDTGDIPPYIIQSTGAKITGASAIQLVNWDKYYIPKPSFVTRKIDQPTNTGFVCNLILPEKAPIIDIMKSQVCTTLENAKREAHMNTCIKLHDLGEIDEYLQITYNKVKKEGITVDDLTTKLSEITILEGKNCYYEKKIPSALSKPINISDENTTNFIYKFSVVLTESGEPYWGQESNEKYFEKPNSYIGIITAESIPYDEVFYHGLDIKAKLTPIQTKTPLKSVYSQLLKFQESVFYEVLNYNKYGINFTFSPNQVNDRNFLICPLKQVNMEEWDFDIQTLNNFTSDAVLHSDSDEFYVHRVVSKKNTPSDYFHIIQMITNDNLDSPFPDPKYASYGDFFSTRCGIPVSKEEYLSPVLEGLHTSSHVNLITSRHKTPQGKDLPKPDYEKKEKTYFFSHTLLIHPIPSTVWRLCVILPSMLYRLESFILMLEFSNSVERCVTTGTGGSPVTENGIMQETPDTPAHLNYQTVPELCVNACGERPDLISLLTAFTAASASDFINSERQEFIGDSLLKLIISLHLFTHTNLRSEGDLSDLRTKYVSNETLYKLAVMKGIVHLMRVDSFLLRKNYSPPGFAFANTALDDTISNLPVDKDKMTFGENLSILTENLNFITQSDPKVSSSLPFRFQQFNNKTSADCIEAVLSSYVCCGGLQQGLKFISYLELGIDYTVQTMDPTYSRHHDEMGHFFNPPSAFSHYASEYDSTELHLPSSLEDISDLPPKFISNIREFQSTVLHYEFENISLLIEAFTHPSFMQRITPTDKARPSYQRLEFLGDALLDYFTCVYVYQKYKYFQPEQLSLIKSAVVNNSRLSTLSLGGKWYKCLLSNDRLKFCIENADNEFNNQRQSRNFNVSDDIEIANHKPLADIVEAVVAAVFVDSRFSLDTSWDVFGPIFKPLIDEMAKRIPKNPVNQLHELKPKSKISVDVQLNAKGLYQCNIRVDGQLYTEIGSSHVLAKNKCAQKVVQSLSRKF